jgi:anaerobic ribonucleoside-triphosphate reductase
MEGPDVIVCPDCGYRGGPFSWNLGYFCPRCESHHDALYREDHDDRERARSMNRADIIAEYHDAGVSFSARRMAG